MPRLADKQQLLAQQRHTQEDYLVDVAGHHAEEELSDDNENHLGFWNDRHLFL